MAKPAYTGRTVQKPKSRPMTPDEVRKAKQVDMQFSKHKRKDNK